MQIKLLLLFFILVFTNNAFSQSEEIIWTKRTLNDLGIKGDVMNAIFSPDDSRICVTTTKTFVELDPANGEIIREIPDIRGVKCFSDDGNFFYTYDLKKVNYKTMEVVGEFELPVEAWTDQLFWTVSGFEVNEKSGLLIAWARQANQMPLPKESIYIYDLNTFQQIKITGLEGNYMAGLVISPNGEYFITYSQYNPDLSTDIEDKVVVMLWETAKLDTIKELEQPTPRGYMKFSPDGNLLGSVSGNLVRVHDTKTWEMKYEFNNNTDYGLLSALDFTSDSKYLATGEHHCPDISLSECMIIYDLEDGKKESSLCYDMMNFGFSKLFIDKKNHRILTSNVGRIGLISFSTSSINDLKKNEILRPNPTTGEVTFNDGSFKEGQLTVTLSDINGNIIKALYEGYYLGEQLTFNISHLPTGTYFITATQDNFIETYKLIKE